MPAWAFSRWGAFRASRRGVFSCGAPALGLVAMVCGLGCAGRWSSRTGIEPVLLRWQADF